MLNTKINFGIRTLTMMLTVMLLTTLFGATAKVSMADPVQVSDRPAVGLILLDNLMSGRSQVGDQVHFETIAPVYDDNNNLLIPAGSPAFGRVTRSKGSGMFGKRGELNFTCEYVTLPNGNNIHLVGRKVRAAGTNDTAETAAVTVLVSPLGLLIKGGTVKYDQGTPIKMFVADGTEVTPSDPNSPDLRADFALQDRKAPDVVGIVKAFDGDTYTVRSQGQDTLIALKDVSSISLTTPVSDNN